MPTIRQDLNAAFGSPVPYIAWAIITLVVSFSGPFGTYDALPLATRLAYWSAVVAVSIFLGVLVRALIGHYARPRDPYRHSALTAGAMAVVLGLPLHQFTQSVVHEAGSRVPSVYEMMAMIFVVGLGIGASRALLTHEPGPKAGDDAPLPRLLDRLPSERRAPVIRCCADDHRVIVVTERGADELLLRFSDAIAELEGVDGLRVHRSHWVAVDKVQGARVEKGRLLLEMSDGTDVPVSRNFREEVEARGLAPL